MSPSEARQANTEIKALLAEGVNPKSKKRQDKLANIHAQKFNDYALEWLAERKRNVKPRTYQQDSNRMHKDVLPHFESIALKDVSFEDCRSMADEIEKRVNDNGDRPHEVTRRTIDLVANILKRAKQERIMGLS